MSLLDLVEETTTFEEPGDHDRFSHYVRKEDIIRSTFEGAPVKALCGKVWVANKSPEKYPVCIDCEAVFNDDERLLGGDA